MTRKQRNSIMVSISAAVVLVIYWIMQGAQLFTKDQVLVDKTTELDKMLGIENKEYVDQFVLGLVPSGFSLTMGFVSVATITALIVVITGIFIYSFRERKGAL